MENLEEQSINIQNDPYLESSKTFHLEMPLYRSYDLSILEVKKKVYELMIFSGTIDAYCIWCNKASVFDGHISNRWVYG